MPLVLVTSNRDKAREFTSIIGLSVEQLELSLVEPQSLSVVDVARQKAIEAYDKLQRPVLVDDSGLVVLEWNGLPGALTSWFLRAVGPDGILRMASGLRSRGAVATTAIGLADESGVQVFVGEVMGHLSDSERGGAGFGYDKIFVPEGQELTLAEMDATVKNSLSMRRLALDKLRGYLIS